jgi:hypothetical protein
MRRFAAGDRRREIRLRLASSGDTGIERLSAVAPVRGSSLAANERPPLGIRGGNSYVSRLTRPANARPEQKMITPCGVDKPVRYVIALLRSHVCLCRILDYIL